VDVARGTKKKKQQPFFQGQVGLTRPPAGEKTKGPQGLGGPTGPPKTTGGGGKFGVQKTRKKGALPKFRSF